MQTEQMFSLVRQVHVTAGDMERTMWIWNVMPLLLWEEARTNADLFCYVTDVYNWMQNNATDN